MAKRLPRLTIRWKSLVHFTIKLKPKIKLKVYQPSFYMGVKLEGKNMERLLKKWALKRIFRLTREVKCQKD
jgi:hypothetical protein